MYTIFSLHHAIHFSFLVNVFLLHIFYNTDLLQFTFAMIHIFTFHVYHNLGILFNTSLLPMPISSPVTIPATIRTGK